MSQKKGVTNENHYCPADEINSDDDEINEPDLDVLSSEIMSELLGISLSSCYERSSTIKVDNESPNVAFRWYIIKIPPLKRRREK